MMNQCVPSWQLDDNSLPHPRLALRAHSNSKSNSVSMPSDVPTLDCEIAELTWENGQLAMHCLGPPRLPSKTAAISSPTKYSWDKPPSGGTLESIVNQATTVPHNKSAIGGGGQVGDELAPWFEENRRALTPATTAASITLTMDALVPCSNPMNNQGRFTEVLESTPGIGTCLVGCSPHVGSCSGAATLDESARETSLARVPHEWSSRPDQSGSASATCGLDSRQVTLDTCDREFCTAGFPSSSLGSPENTSSDKQCTDPDSVCHSRNQREAAGEEEKKKGSGKLSVSTKRSRAAAIHNQSERKRRDKINQRMKTLQKLVPNSSKTDKASMLDEVIEYLKQLQAQVQMMSRMNMTSMILPLALQQQLQMSMMAPLGMGMNMGMGLGVMDMNTMGRANIAGMPPVLNPTAFVPTALTSWDGSGDRLASSASAMPDPLSAFLACQSQPMTMDAYSRMAALYQQFQQHPGPASKNKAM